MNRNPDRVRDATIHRRLNPGVMVVWKRCWRALPEVDWCVWFGRLPEDDNGLTWGTHPCCQSEGGMGWDVLPFYSTDPAAALALDGEMFKREFVLHLVRRNAGHFSAYYRHRTQPKLLIPGPKIQIATDHDERLARAEAALKALQVERKEKA